jgi:hypothetical protein
MEKAFSCNANQRNADIDARTNPEASESALLLPQKRDALHAFALPIVHYLLQSGDISISQVTSKDVSK